MQWIFLIEFTALASPVTWQKELYELNDAMKTSSSQQNVMNFPCRFLLYFSSRRANDQTRILISSTFSRFKINSRHPQFSALENCF
jgi:hypothetical protein